MTLIRRQTTEEFGSYLWCHGCGTATLDPCWLIEGTGTLLPTPPDPNERWLRLCDDCMKTIIDTVKGKQEDLNESPDQRHTQVDPGAAP